ncbi:MAG: outer membrane protein assembly factor BamB, partial [Proteobacteria bacterium]|nr:outer membrane protein assembly factor BamB [Pseudomonadota bacterium]
WTQEAFLNRDLTKPAYYFGDLLLGDLEGYIHVLDSTSGNILAKTRVGSESFSHAPLVVADTIYNYNLDGSLSAMKYKR